MGLMTFRDMLDAYWIEDRTLFGFGAGDSSVTLRFDLYHCDDAERSADETEYLLDVAIAHGRFRIVDGSAERLRQPFSADILKVDLDGDTLRIVSDCVFHASRERDIVTFLLLGGEATVIEHPPKRIV